MNIEEYKKELVEWKKSHIDFYNEYVHVIKSRKATLTTYIVGASARQRGICISVFTAA